LPLAKLGNYNDITYIPKSYLNRAQSNTNNNQQLNNNNSQLSYLKQAQNMKLQNNNTNNNFINKDLIKPQLTSAQQYQTGMQGSMQGDSKSFMYGKIGWVCSMCKNFNYESKI
jgi:hypothetical protein